MRVSAGLCLVLCLSHGILRANESESLFNPVTYQALSADKKAFKTGDLLTVVIQEAASASTAADSKAKRSTGLAVQADPWKGVSHNSSASVGTDSSGGGSTQRTGRLLAQLTVTVASVEPNGDLLIHGRQDLAINGESQIITLDGRVRTKDITDGNSVPSTRIADARIRFEGEGFISEKSRPGWISKVLTLFGL